MEKITGIKAVTFDGDGTLWDFDESMRYALSMVHKELEKLDSVAAAMLNVDDM
jgi:phosphoglycolate phosphatase-like HAD superfamily hydrolase